MYDSVRLGLCLVDDGSSDGTAETVGERYPEVNLIVLTGTYDGTGECTGIR